MDSIHRIVTYPLCCIRALIQGLIRLPPTRRCNFSLALLFICSPNLLLAYNLCSPSCLLIVHPLSYSFIYSTSFHLLTHSLARLYTRPVAHLLIHSFIRLYTRPAVHLLTHSLTFYVLDQLFICPPNLLPAYLRA